MRLKSHREMPSENRWRELNRKPVKHRALVRAQFLSERRTGFDQSLCIGKVLEPLRAPPRRVRPSTDLLPQQIGGHDDKKGSAVDHNLDCGPNRLRQRGIVRELHMRPIGGSPILGVLVRVETPESVRQERITRNRPARQHRKIDIECRAWVGMMDLHRNTANDRVRDTRIAQNAAQGPERTWKQMLRWRADSEAQA
jgi:hypothetical protein